MKKNKFLLITGLIFIFYCGSSVPYLPNVALLNPNLKPSNLKVAFLPTVNNGNPKKVVDYNVSSKFQIAFKEFGFKVVNYQIVESIIKEMSAKPNSLSNTQLKNIQNKLDCDALVMSSIDYQYIPPQGGARVNNYGGSAQDVGEYYRATSESLVIIDYNSFETILEATIRSDGYSSMSDRMILGLRNEFNRIKNNVK